MAVATTTGPARGWYPDPKNQAELRWWDGSRWTGHRTAVAAVVPEPEADYPRQGTNEAFRAALEAARAARAGLGSAPVVEPEPQPEPAPQPEPEPEIVAAV